MLTRGSPLLVDWTRSLGQETGAEFTFLLTAGRTECFFQTVLKDWTLEVEYQVIAGAGLDVGFTLTDPSGHRVVSDFRSSDGIHAVDSTQDGDYQLCFDNSYSKLAAKMVFFEVVVDAQGLSGRAGDEAPWGPEDAADSYNMEGYNMEDIRTSMDSVHRRLERIRHFQNLLRSTEARDRYLLEDNLWRVSFWSCLNLLVVLAVASTQVYTLRRLFQDNRRTST
ncbi:hypothetical protein CRUP_018980 [Coryphaenoides rupestris]|nr:hypothetical protein CRUP_018980 [Coryphaenoides rupestris]